jgi:hypothetical protein
MNIVANSNMNHARHYTGSIRRGERKLLDAAP